MASQLVNNEDWIYFDMAMKPLGNGNGTDSLKPLLQENQCGYAFWRIVRENVGNTGPGVITEANIVLQWKGPKTNAIAKVKSNAGLDNAMKLCPLPNKGFIEVLTKGNLLSGETIFDRFKPGSGSKTIQD